MAINLDKYSTKKTNRVPIYARAEPELKSAINRFSKKNKITYNEAVLVLLRSALANIK